MRKRLIGLSLSLLLGGAAAIGLIAPTASAQSSGKPMLAQTTPGTAARGRGNRPAPTAADRAARRGEACQEVYARAAGRFAALEVRLNLTAAQTGAFNRWRDQRLATAKRRASECAAQPGRGGQAMTMTMPSPVERLSRQETRLQHRLADIQAERPALEALYTSLNTAQRQTLARERGFGARERGGLRRGAMRMMRGGPDQDGNRMFRRGPQGPGMMGMERGPMRDRGMLPPPGDQPPPQ